MTDKVVIRSEGLRPGDVVDLYTIDLNPIGYNAVLYFQQADAKGGSVWFGGKEYVPRPIKVSGFKKSSEDVPPEPTLLIGNVDKGGYALLNTYGELLGAKVTRTRTYAEFLDRLPDGVTANPNADSSASFLPEIWYIEQKGPSNRVQVSFRLKAITDLGDRQFPARQVLKHVCRREYRYWDAATSSFKYSTKNACPYASPTYFKRSGASTAIPAEDECGKDPGSCKLRFGENLPGWFFPGVSKVGS
jgi:lambda family phage minor tail protein L